MARLQMNMTQKELGACVGLHSYTVYLLEKNKAKDQALIPGHNIQTMI